MIEKNFYRFAFIVSQFSLVVDFQAMAIKGKNFFNFVIFIIIEEVFDISF
jgi:hypothetical protein